MSLLGLDIGITGCKAVAFSASGRALAEAYREYPLYQPHPGWMELDPEEVWAAVRNVVCGVTAAIPGDPVGALAISTHGESVVPLDARGRPLYRFITAIDTRATEEAAWWGDNLGKERLFRISGMPLHPMYTVNKLMWLRRHDPEVFAAARRFTCMPDFLLSRLGLPPTMDYSLAARTMMFDVGRLDWSQEILDLAGMDRGRLSALAPSGPVLGEVSPQVAAELGLARGAIAVVGGHDQPSGALGCGAVSEGIVMDSTGTVECVAAATPRLVLDEALMEANLPIAPHTAPGMYLVLGWSSTGGALLRWFRDNFAQAEQAEAARTGASVYDLILAQAAPGPSPVLILPHFVGTGTPWMDPMSKGAILGLDLSTTRGQVIKAILDSVSYETKLSLDAMEAGGIAIRDLRAFGGDRSAAWLQTKANIYGKLVVAMDVAEAPCLGVALIAGVATGVFDSIADGLAQMVRAGRTYRAGLAAASGICGAGRRLRAGYPALATLNHQL
jgi:xylulokinase